MKRKTLITTTRYVCCGISHVDLWREIHRHGVSALCGHYILVMGLTRACAVFGAFINHRRSADTLTSRTVDAAA